MSISRFLKNMTVAVGVVAASLAATTSAHAVSLSEITARGKVKIGVLTGAPPMAWWTRRAILPVMTLMSPI